MTNILVINAGSSSLKYQLIDMDGGRVWWGDDYQTEQLWSSDV